MLPKIWENLGQATVFYSVLLKYFSQISEMKTDFFNGSISENPCLRAVAKALAAAGRQAGVQSVSKFGEVK